MSRYAENTSVPSDRSRAEIERTVERYGATGFSYGWKGGVASIMFELPVPTGSRRIRFMLPMPDRNARQFTLTPAGRAHRSPTAAAAAYDQAVRQRWRALALVIKAKLEAVAAGIATIEEEFLAHIVLPDAHGSTVGEWVQPQLEAAYATGELPRMLPGGVPS